MAQLKVKQTAKVLDDKKKPSKMKKYKRKRDVFGHSLKRIWIFVLIIVEIIAISVSVFVVKNKQNDEKKVIDKEITVLKKEIKTLRDKVKVEVESYENIGNLIATLPSSSKFDEQSCSIDISRLIEVSGLSESKTTKRMYRDDATMPFECSVESVKAVQITFVATANSIDNFLLFLDNVTNYQQENFFYVSSFKYNYNSATRERSCAFTIFTFYNQVAV